MDRTDVHDALSWDRLHAYHLGLFGDHLLAHLRDLVKPSRNAVATMDDQCVPLAIQLNQLRISADSPIFRLDLIPPWAGLTHFTSFEKSSEFNDGKKLEDLSKVQTCLYDRLIHLKMNTFSDIGYTLCCIQCDKRPR
jgi:hypothetical protein